MKKVKKTPKAGGRIAQVGTLPMLYVVFWSFAGAASAAYLSLVLTDPEIVGLSSSGAAPNAQAPAEVLASPEARTLRNRLSEAQKDIAQLRTELSEHKEAAAAAEESEPAPAASAEVAAAEPVHEQPAMGETQSAAEASIPSEDRLASADHANAAPAASHDAEASSPDPGPAIPGVSIAAPPAAPPVVQTALPDTPALSTVSEVAIAHATIVNAPVEPSTIETGALATPPTPAPGLRPKPKPAPIVAVAKPKPPAARTVAAANPAETVTFGQATVVPGPAERTPAIGVRLASAPSLDALRLTWNAMRERHGETLRGLKARYVKQNPSNAGTGPYTLVAGPVAKPTDVLEICAGLGGESLECALTEFEGRTL